MLSSIDVETTAEPQLRERDGMQRRHHYVQWDDEYDTMRSRTRRGGANVAAVLACLALAVFLGACDSGGGGSTTTDDTSADMADTASNTCTNGGQCDSGVCDLASGTCADPSCDDTVQNGDETDVDCGGSCDGCTEGSACRVGADCVSGSCSAGFCTTASCTDGVQNGDESDVDCGGSCEACADGAACATNDDCMNGACQNGTCAGASCSDGAQNGDETGVDCGGSCDGCPADSACTTGDDCLSGVCVGGLCAAPTCMDNTTNGDETDQDCGGPSCDPCGLGAACTQSSDCQSNACDPGTATCVETHCMDGLLNGDETATDCGGSCAGCPDSSPCEVGDDCQSGVCDESSGTCAAAACDDLIQNGDETDVDCGGSCADLCAQGQGCGDDTDCASGFCDTNAGICVTYPSCQAILEAGRSTGDGEYVIDPDGTDPNVPFLVYCDMTTDGGGWTAIDPDLVINTTRDGTSDHRLTRTDLAGTGLCDLSDGGFLRGRGDTGVHCRYDFDIGFEFNAIRTGADPASDAVSIAVDAGSSSNDSDLTWVDEPWGSDSCSGAGDVRFGTASDDKGELSLGRYMDVAPCGPPISDTNGTVYSWADDEMNTVRGSILRLEFSEDAGEDVGWRWDAGRVYVRNEIGFTAALTTADPGMWEDGTIGTSCEDYVQPSGMYARATRSGVYAIDPDGAGGNDPINVYCEMRADGGGWRLLGVISGADADNWNTEIGYWGDSNTLGSIDDVDSDLKTQAWLDLDVSKAEILFERQYDGNIEAQTVLANECLDDQTNFVDLFASVDVSRACDLPHIRTLRGSAVGVSSSTYAEGSGIYALGGSSTNGFCWFGGDTVNNIFDGHLLWNQYPGATDCLRSGHLSGVGVYANSSSQYSNADITGTNWLNGTNFGLTVIRLYARDGMGIAGALTDADPGTWEDGSLAASCDEYRHPTAPRHAYAGSTGDGIYAIDPDGDGPASAYNVYCDMTTDGGGWTLLGIVSGADMTDSWNTELGYWSDDNLLGAIDARDADFKSQAWLDLDISGGEVMLERQYDGNVEAQSVLTSPCLNGQTHFVDLFASKDTSRACTPGQIRTITGSAVGVASTSYAEGSGTSALGGSSTNGFCWFGGDTSGNIFDGHIVWNQYPDVTNCAQAGHLGGIAVYANSSSQYENADITGTNWLNGTDFTLTVIRFYAR